MNTIILLADTAKKRQIKYTSRTFQSIDKQICRLRNTLHIQAQNQY